MKSSHKILISWQRIQMKIVRTEQLTKGMLHCYSNYALTQKPDYQNGPGIHGLPTKLLSVIFLVLSYLKNKITPKSLWINGTRVKRLIKSKKGNGTCIRLLIHKGFDITKSKTGRERGGGEGRGRERRNVMLKP